MLGIGQFDDRIDEGTTSEAGAFELVLQCSEERFKAIHPFLEVASHPFFKHSIEPLFPVSQDGQNQVVLRGEVVVQSHLGDFRLGDDPVDPHGSGSLGVKQPLGGFDDSLAGLGFGFCLAHDFNIQTCLFIVKGNLGDLENFLEKWHQLPGIPLSE